MYTNKKKKIKEDNNLYSRHVLNHIALHATQHVTLEYLHYDAARRLICLDL